MSKPMLKASLCAVTLALCPYAVGDTGEAQQVQSDIQHWIDRLQDETDKTAPVDYGYGPGVSIPKAQSLSEGTVSTVHSAAAQIPTGGSSAHLAGVFGAPITWPIIPIHVVLLPDGRVMSYGTNQLGQQGAQLIYDVWNPTLGTSANSHDVLPNTTKSDIFCSSQSVMLSGQVLITGGDLTVNGVRNFARNNTNIFTPSSNTLSANTPMNYARWYGSLVSLSNGQLVVFGGYQNQVTQQSPEPAPTPEVYNPETHAWVALHGATSLDAFGYSGNWYYPRAYEGPGGKILVVGNDGLLYSVSTAGSGSISRYTVIVPAGAADLPTVPFAPGKLLLIRNNKTVAVIDYTNATPVVSYKAGIDAVRFWANGTVMADGRVLITGGSAVANELTSVDYRAEIWDPSTGLWTAGASATKPRLYHSNSLLLPDATVLTGGGGAPGPVINLNAEIYYPPYLYDSDGLAASRPTISAVSPRSLNPGGTLDITVGATDQIGRLTFVRSGSSTHSNNSDQRFIVLSFKQIGQNLTATLPGDPVTLVPGHYMLFAFDKSGVPSVAQLVAVE